MASAGKIGYAVVGLGILARNAILPAFANCKHSRLVALVSRDAKKAAELGKKYKASKIYSTSNFDGCLKNPEISAVYVVTPPGQHEEFTVRAAQAGKHVLCEKPLAATVKQSGKMVGACRQTGVLLMTAYRKYFEPSTVYLKSLIASGALGRIDAIHTSFSEIYNPKSSPLWLLDPSLAGGGPMMDLGVYCVNTSRWLVGEDPAEAVAQSWRHDKRRFANVEEGMAFQLRFPSGLMVQGTSTYNAAISSFVYVQGSKGWMALSPAYTFDDERHLTGKIGGRTIYRRFKVINEFAAELDAFSLAIRKKKPVEPDGVQGHRDMIILNAIYQSARTNQPVAINYSAKEAFNEQ
jgi:predicted dehydrogenase